MVYSTSDQVEFHFIAGNLIVNEVSIGYGPSFFFFNILIIIQNSHITTVRVQMLQAHVFEKLYIKIEQHTFRFPTSTYELAHKIAKKLFKSPLLPMKNSVQL